jgi:SAM-dependent methyltransferase
MWHGRASKIPLPDNHFDMVVAFETMEHWTEWQDSPINGLREINRVLKPGRKLVVTVPIHLHGGDEFVSGDIEKILGYFDLSQWDVKTYEWRREHAPLPVHKGFNNSRRRKIYTQLTEEGFAKQTVQKEPSTWCLNIVAVKR